MEFWAIAILPRALLPGQAPTLGCGGRPQGGREGRNTHFPGMPKRPAPLRIGASPRGGGSSHAAFWGIGRQRRATVCTAVGPGTFLRIPKAMCRPWRTKHAQNTVVIYTAAHRETNGEWRWVSTTAGVFTVAPLALTRGAAPHLLLVFPSHRHHRSSRPRITPLVPYLGTGNEVTEVSDVATGYELVPPGQQPSHGHAKGPRVLSNLGGPRRIVKGRLHAFGRGVGLVERLIRWEVSLHRLRSRGGVEPGRDKTQTR